MDSVVRTQARVVIDNLVGGIAKQLRADNCK